MVFDVEDCLFLEKNHQPVMERCHNIAPHPFCPGSEQCQFGAGELASSVMKGNCRESLNPQNATTLHLQNAAAKGSLGIPSKKCTCLNRMNTYAYSFANTYVYVYM